MLNLVISTIVFFIAAWYFNRYLDEQEITKGMTRGVFVFVLASLVSWGPVLPWIGRKSASQVHRLPRQLWASYPKSSKQQVRHSRELHPTYRAASIGGIFFRKVEESPYIRQLELDVVMNWRKPAKYARIRHAEFLAATLSTE